MTERVASYTQTIYVSQPSTLHSQRWKEPLEMHWRNLHSIMDKTQVTAFHLKNKEAKQSLKVVWNRTELDNNPPTVHSTLYYESHQNSKWGANASTIRTTVLALSYSVAANAAPVLARSHNAQKLNTELNSACRAVTECLKPNNVEDLYLLAGIMPPDTRRDGCARMEKTKRKALRPTLYMGNTLQREVQEEITNNTTKSYCQPKRKPSKRI